MEKNFCMCGCNKVKVEHYLLAAYPVNTIKKNNYDEDDACDNDEDVGDGDNDDEDDGVRQEHMLAAAYRAR